MAFYIKDDLTANRLFWSILFSDFVNLYLQLK